MFKILLALLLITTCCLAHNQQSDLSLMSTVLPILKQVNGPLDETKILNVALPIFKDSVKQYVASADELSDHKFGKMWKRALKIAKAYNVNALSDSQFGLLSTIMKEAAKTDEAKLINTALPLLKQVAKDAMSTSADSQFGLSSLLKEVAKSDEAKLIETASPLLKMVAEVAKEAMSTSADFGLSSLMKQVSKTDEAKLINHALPLLNEVAKETISTHADDVNFKRLRKALKGLKLHNGNM